MKKIILTVAFIVSAAGAFAQTASTLNTNGATPVTTTTPPTINGNVTDSKLGNLKKDIRADKKDVHADLKDARADTKNLRGDIKQRRLDIKNGDKAAAIALTKDIRQHKIDIRKDRRDIRNDKRDIRRDIRHAKRIARHEHHLNHAPDAVHKAAPVK